MLYDTRITTSFAHKQAMMTGIMSAVFLTVAIRQHAP